MNVEQALKAVGFEVKPIPGASASVYQGAAVVAPVFGFVDAFEVVDVVNLNGERREGSFLVCLDPGTGNLMQTFDLNDNGRFLGR